MKLYDNTRREQLGWIAEEDILCHLSCEGKMRGKYPSYCRDRTLRLEFVTHVEEAKSGMWCCCGCGERLRHVGELPVVTEEEHFG